MNFNLTLDCRAPNNVFVVLLEELKDGEIPWIKGRSIKTACFLPGALK